ncbi:(2Fe-2S)-binding protein [Streptomonospora wellingtoniae]|uniref:(2Fe-2S)-binding protein n=1 Tax=Streptomonospora wellingtoniae TaxID=3075544 RepID=A0ABU2KX29_9ACTN|nr:(2Fe-2S)-binding protein [Streptomonospora sp. DSM 45055]MDT0303857.1 (2Fe-2S)-binding protein [Streptomonospora sp. DSM 45055]
MAVEQAPLRAVIDACRPLKFAPLPDVRTTTVQSMREHPATEHWYRTDLMVAEGAVGALFHQLTAQHGPGHKLPAATHFMRSLLREPIFLVSAGIYLTGRAALLDERHLWFPWLSTSAFGAPTITSARMAVLPDDPAAGHPDAVVVPDEAALNAIAARHLVRTFSPIIDALHAHTRVGLRTLWGWVLDTQHFYMLNPARFLGRDAEAAWRRAGELGDALIEAGAVTRARPRLFPFYEDHPRGTWAVRGTCCFDYKGDPEHGFCTTCPLKCDDDRRTELQEWIRNPALAP